MRAAALVALALSACARPDRGPRWQAAGATTPRDGGTLRFASKDAVATLDPARAVDELSVMVLHPMLDTLVDYEPGGTHLVPRLAERWDVSTDGLAYHFVLRADARYADGRPIDAGDVAYSLERALRLEGSTFGSYIADIVGAADVAAGKAEHCAGITVLGHHELEIRIAQPNTAFLAVLAMPFTAPNRPDHVAGAGDQLRRTPLASGPYMLAEWDEGQRLVLVRNPYYAERSRAHLDSIVVLENVARDTQFLMFERGELDTAERLAAPDYLWVMSQPAWRPYVKSVPLMSVFGSRFNVNVPPFDDRRVRQAFNYAVDRGHIARLLNGTVEPAHGMLPPGIAGRDDALAPYPHDPAKARALLAEAGVRDLSVVYVTLADEEAEKLAASLQSDLAEVGVTMQISLMTVGAWATAVGKPDGPAFSYDGWTGDFPDPTSFFDPKFHSRAIAEQDSTNNSYYKNAELDDLLDRARGERDPALRATLYRRAEHILYDDAPWIFGYHQRMTEVIQPYVRDYAPHPIWLRDYTSAWLDITDDGPVAKE